MTDAERRLFDLPRFADAGASAYRPGFERMHALLAVLGAPHHGLPVVHVAGTNGKGSTASFVASIASAAGLRVGLHTSPHLVTLRERMRVDGEPATEAWLAAAVARLSDTLNDIGPSFFEATVALSLAYFAEQSVDLAVVEVGLGGRLDATNVVESVVSAVTHIGLDHTDLLGGTVEAIAREKAGIARPGVSFLHAVSGRAASALAGEATRRGAHIEAVRRSCRVETAPGQVPLATPRRDYGAVEVGLPGAHQAWNAALATRAAEVACEALGHDLSAEAVRRGLAEVVARSGVRGRGERWAEDPRVVLDVAHNADGWRVALGALDVPAGGALWVLVGLMADKDADALAETLAAHDVRAFVLGLGGDRGLPAEALAAALRRRGVSVDIVPSARAALTAFARDGSPDDRLLITGSHQTVAAALG